MNKKLGTLVVAVILIAAGVVVYILNNRSSSSDSPSPSNSSATTSPNNSSSNQQNAPGTSFTVNANDLSADITTLTVKKGTIISVTFKVSGQGVYHGGLEFKSNVVSSGPILPGQSQTITFTANKSFDFTPYWYQSDVKKDYLISVKVN